MSVSGENSQGLPGLDVDLGELLGDSGSSSVSAHSVDGGVTASGGVSGGVGVDVSVTAPDGSPEIGVDVEGGVAAYGQAGVEGSYDSTEVGVDADAGTTDVTMQSAQGEADVYGGVDVGGGVGIDVGIGDSGVPEIEVSAGAEYGSYGGFDADGSYGAVEIHDDGGDDAYLG